MRRESRAALLTSKKAIDAGKLSNREELLRSSAVRDKQDLNEKVTYVWGYIHVTSGLDRLLPLLKRGCTHGG